MLAELAEANDFLLHVTEDADDFVVALAEADVVVFLNTSGNILDTRQQNTFRRWYREGRGFVGIHSAVDTEYHWAWYEGLVGAYFADHPGVHTALVQVEIPNHPSTRHLPPRWERTDEWYDFQTNPRRSVTVLLNLREDSYEGGHMGRDHPISWFSRYDGGRAWYTAMGHTVESYAEPLFAQHVLGGILWAASRAR